MEFTHLVRYRVDFVGQLFATYLFFLLLLWGGKSVATRLNQTASFGSGIEGIIVGFFLVIMVQASYQSMSKHVMQESRRGTLEQLYITPYGFGWVMLGQVAIQIVLSIVMGSMLLGLMLFTTGRTLAIDVFTVLPIIFLTLLSVVGLGLLLAGLTLVYKKISSIINVTQLIVLGLVGAPLFQSPVLRYLPVAQGSIMLQRAMTGSASFREFPPSDIAILCVVGIVYFGVGYLLFLHFLRLAKSRGVMGHY